MRKASCEFEAERHKAAKEKRRRQKERAASLPSSSQTIICLKCDRGCTSRIGLYSHQWASKNWPLTFQTILVCEEWAIIIIINKVTHQQKQSLESRNTKHLTLSLGGIMAPRSPMILSWECVAKASSCRVSIGSVLIRRLGVPSTITSVEQESVQGIFFHDAKFYRFIIWGINIKSFLFFFGHFFSTSFIPCGKSGSPYPGKATVTRAALPILNSVCSIFQCPNNGMAASAWDL